MSRLSDRWKYSATNTRFWNWRGQRARERGRRDLAARIGDQVRSRTPVVRGRINRATGRPHRDDLSLGRSMDRSLARAKERPGKPRSVAARERAEREKFTTTHVRYDYGRTPAGERRRREAGVPLNRIVRTRRRSR